MVESKLVGKWIMFIRCPLIPSQGDEDLLGTAWEIQHVFQNFDKQIVLHVQDSDGTIMETLIYSGKQLFRVFDHFEDATEWCTQNKHLIEKWEVRDVL